MEHQFTDKTLVCSDCKREFVFTAGEQLFFHEKQFKNDPKRCKPCKSRRGAPLDAASGDKPAPGVLLRTETRTECSECGVETTVPFKPTQGRPVLCRQCFQNRGRAAAASAPRLPSADVAGALSAISADSNGNRLSASEATMAAAAMETAPNHSSVASIADLQTITALPPEVDEPEKIPLELIAAGDGPVDEDMSSLVEALRC